MTLNQPPHWAAHSRAIGHISWRASDDWFIGDDTGSYSGGNKTAPYGNDPMSIYQVFFNQTTHEFSPYRNLLTKPSAGAWISYQPGSTCLQQSDCTHWKWNDCSYSTRQCYSIINFGSFPLPTIRDDGEQLIFTSTDGHCSYDDYIYEPTACSSNDWGFTGFFLVDLVPINPADVNNDRLVNIKDIQEVIRCIINSKSCNFPDRSDVNDDTRINIKDIQEIIRKIITP